MRFNPPPNWPPPPPGWTPEPGWRPDPHWPPPPPGWQLWVPDPAGDAQPGSREPIRAEGGAPSAVETPDVSEVDDATRPRPDVVGHAPSAPPAPPGPPAPAAPPAPPAGDLDGDAADGGKAAAAKKALRTTGSVLGAIFNVLEWLLDSIESLLYNLLLIAVAIGAAVLAGSAGRPELFLVSLGAVALLVLYWTTGWGFFD